MADTKKLEREYVIPLRKEWLKTPMHKRAKKAIRAVRMFLARHMKVEFDDVRIGRFLNEQLWARGAKNPPHKIKVKVEREGDVARAELLELSEDQKKIIADEKKIEDEKKKENEEKIKKEKEAEKKAEEKAKKEEKKKDSEEEKEEKEKKKELLKEDVKEIKKEVREEQIKEKVHPKENPQSQAQHTMKRQHSE